MDPLRLSVVTIENRGFHHTIERRLLERSLFFRSLFDPASKFEAIDENNVTLEVDPEGLTTALAYLRWQDENIGASASVWWFVDLDVDENRLSRNLRLIAAVEVLAFLLFIEPAKDLLFYVDPTQFSLDQLSRFLLVPVLTDLIVETTATQYSANQLDRHPDLYEAVMNKRNESGALLVEIQRVKRVLWYNEPVSLENVSDEYRRYALGELDPCWETLWFDEKPDYRLLGRVQVMASIGRGSFVPLPLLSYHNLLHLTREVLVGGAGDHGRMIPEHHTKSDPILWFDTDTSWETWWPRHNRFFHDELEATCLVLSRFSRKESRGERIQSLGWYVIRLCVDSGVPRFDDYAGRLVRIFL